MALAIGGGNGAARGAKIDPNVKYVAAIVYRSIPFPVGQPEILGISLNTLGQC
jgi:hypothetical protein